MNVTLLLFLYDTILLTVTVQNVEYTINSNSVGNGILCSVQNGDIMQVHDLKIFVH